MTNIEPTIRQLQGKNLIGMRTTITPLNDKTIQLWQTFMPRRTEVGGRLNSDFISMQIFKSLPEPPFEQQESFENWAAVEVTQLDNVPDGMEQYTIPGGLYAVFTYTGLAREFMQTYKHMISSWLPQSGYGYDHRPQFQVMTEAYDPNDPNAEEEVWIPIKQ